MSAENSGTDNKVIIMNGFSHAEISHIMRQVRALYEVPSDIIFATTTPQSLEMRLDELIEDMSEDHHYLKKKPPAQRTQRNGLQKGDETLPCPAPLPFVASIPRYRAGARFPDGADGVKLSSNESLLGTGEKSIQAAQGRLPKAYQYPDGASSQLREAIAAQWKLTPEQVIVGNGSDELLMLAVSAFVPRGAKGCFAQHTFGMYEFTLRCRQARGTAVGMENGQIAPHHLIEACDPHTRMIFICNPNNPTGGYLNEDALRQVLQKIPSNILVVLDEAYAEFANAPDFPNSRRLVEEFPNIMVLRTFSKVYGLAGLRIGYGIGDVRVIDALSRMQLPFSVNIAAQQAGEAALQDRQFMERHCALVIEHRERLMKALQERNIEYYPSHANFVCAKVPEDIAEHAGTSPASMLAHTLMRHRVAVRPLDSFGMPQWIRISVGTEAQLERFITAYDTIAAAQ